MHTPAQPDPRTRFQPLIRIARLIHRQLIAERATPLTELRSRLTYLNDEFIELDRIRVLEGEHGVTHLRYRVSHPPVR